MYELIKHRDITVNNANFVNSNNPFFKRGGNRNNNATNSGIFYFNNNNGNDNSNNSFRLALKYGKNFRYICSRINIEY